MLHQVGEDCGQKVRKPPGLGLLNHVSLHQGMQDAEGSEMSLREAGRPKIRPVGLMSCLDCWMYLKGMGSCSSRIIEEHGTVLV